MVISLAFVFTIQIKFPLLWIQNFFSKYPGALRRKYTVESHYNRGPIIEMIADVSPFGLGAILVIDGVAKACFSDVASDADNCI